MHNMCTQAFINSKKPARPQRVRKDGSKIPGGFKSKTEIYNLEQFWLAQCQFKVTDYCRP